MIGRLLCRWGRHDWRTTRYWTLSNQWAEGPECHRCGLLALHGRRLVAADVKLTPTPEEAA